MRICVVSSTIFPVGATGLGHYGGLEQIAWQCAKGLAEKGHDVCLVGPKGTILPNGKALITGDPGKHSEKAAFDLIWRELPKFDCIIDHSWHKYAYLLKGDGNLKAPVLGVMHAPVNTMYGSLPPNVDKPCFVCISKDQANHFTALYEKPAEVCYNGIDLDFYKPLGVERTKRFLFLARFSSIKGPDIAIRACKDVGVGLDLVGDTSITGEPDYYHHCKSMCDGQQIKMVGPATRSECIYWLSQAHCLLHPNERFREPFGLAPVEAMACECPVIAWKRGAMTETIVEGETGLLADTYDSYVTHVKTIANVLKDSDRARCRTHASRYSVQNMVDRYEQLVFRAVNAGGW